MTLGPQNTSDWLELLGAVVAAILAWLHGRKVGKGR